MQGLGIDAAPVAVARLDCKYSRLGSFSSAMGLDIRGKKCWFYSPGACTCCHTFIHITDILPLEGQLSR